MKAKEAMMAPSVRWALIILVLAVAFGRALDKMMSGKASEHSASPSPLRRNRQSARIAVDSATTCDRRESTTSVLLKRTRLHV